MKFFEIALAIGGPVLQACLAVLLWVRSLHKQFRAFFAYTAFAVLSGIVGITLQGNHKVYFYFYWTSQLIYLLLTCLALYEVFKMVFRNFFVMPWFRFVFPAGGLLMLALVVLRNISTPTTEGHPVFMVIVSLEITVRFLQLGILLLFFILAKFFHLRWRQYAFGIALGFGIAAAGSLVVFLLRSEFGTKVDYFVRITPPIAYLIAVTSWLFTFTNRQPESRLPGQASALVPEQVVAELRQYTRTVKEILKR